MRQGALWVTSGPWWVCACPPEPAPFQILSHVRHGFAFDCAPVEPGSSNTRYRVKFISSPSSGSAQQRIAWRRRSRTQDRTGCTGGARRRTGVQAHRAASEILGAMDKTGQRDGRFQTAGSYYSPSFVIQHILPFKRTAVSESAPPFNILQSLLSRCS